MKALLLVAATSCFLLQAQQEYTVSFADATRPRVLKADLMNGRMTIKGYSGNDAVLVQDGNARPPQKDRGGWNRIDPRFDITLSQQNNVVTIGGGLRREAHLTVQVPYQTSLQLHCVNCGELRVENVEGDIDISNNNGPIRLNNVSGSILANSLNHSIQATITRLDPNKPTSFSSLNGSLDCTFPADLKANLKMRTENGKIHSDFDIRLGGGTIMRTDRGINGTINGGGPEIQFKAFNGSIYLRKKQ